MITDEVFWYGVGAGLWLAIGLRGLGDYLRSRRARAVVERGES